MPTSAGAYAPGQERAPHALRKAGLVELLRDGGVEVSDYGDCPTFRWRPDRERPRAQNLGKVVEIVRDTGQRVEQAVLAGETSVVLGGDCTVGIGSVAGHLETSDRVGLVYFDLHTDLNIPDSVPEGALDWMGMAHMLGEKGAERDLVEVGPRTPLADPGPGRRTGVGRGPGDAAWERDAVDRLELEAIPVAEVREDPRVAATEPCISSAVTTDRILVHFDVDVIDFTDTPLSENPGRNEGITYDQAMAAIEVLAASPDLAGLTVTELNPEPRRRGRGKHRTPGARPRRSPRPMTST